MTTLETKADAEALINKEGIEYVSVRFTDLIGVQQHFTVPASEFLKDAFCNSLELVVCKFQLWLAEISI